MEWLNYHPSSISGSSPRRAASPKRASSSAWPIGDQRSDHRWKESRRNCSSARDDSLTDSGRVAFRYADEIFSLGREFQDVLKDGRAASRCGSSSACRRLAKSIVHRILEPAFSSGTRSGSSAARHARPTFRRRPRDSCGRRRALRCAGRARHAGAHVQPSARRVRVVILRGAEARQRLPQAISEVARRRPGAGPRWRLDVPARVERVVRVPRHSPGDHRRAR